MSAKRFGVPVAALIAFFLLFPSPSPAQTDERLEANHLYGAFGQMGAAHMAAFLDAKVQLMQALTYLIGAARASSCIDPEPWVQILKRLEAGASARSVFPDIIALMEMPKGTVLPNVNRYRCRCTDDGGGGATGGGGGRCPNGSLACGFCLGTGIYNRWIEYGGERGILDCPIMDEAEAARSPQGTYGRYAQFRGGDGGYIFWQATGARAGQVIVVRGCMFKVYRDARNSASAFGFPLGDEYPVPGGRRQDFEGGSIFWNEQTGACEGHAGGTPPDVQPPQPPVPDAEAASCDTNAVDRSRKDGTRYTFTCPQNCPTRSIWGTDHYTSDSALCTAAVHAELITQAGGGTVTIEIRTNPGRYTGSRRGGVTSQDFDRPWPHGYVFVGGTPRRTAARTFNLSRILVVRSYRGESWGTSAARPGEQTYSAGQRSFPLGWDYRWPESGENMNRVTSEVTLTRVPAHVEVGARDEFAASMTGEWITTGYGVARDHTIQLEGAAGTREWSEVGDPVGTVRGQVATTGIVSVPEASGNQIVFTIVASVRFGGDHWGRMEIRLVYE